MTVKEFVKVIENRGIRIISGGMAIPLEVEDPIQMAAYGDFIVERANFFIEGEEVMCEITLQLTPARKGAA